MTTTKIPVDYRELIKEVEQLVDAIEESAEPGTTVRTATSQIIRRFRDKLGIYGGRLYERDGDAYELRATFPDAKPIVGVRVPRTYAPIELLLEEGSIYMDRNDPRIDRELESALGVEEFAGVEVGGERYILAFNVAPGYPRDDVLLSLGVIRHSLNQKIRQERMEDVFRQAREIQSSIMPRRAPRFGEFNITGHHEYMEGVGGDFFDYIPITDKILGVAIADVSGHGLPAALQVRDIYTGLRMGMARDFKSVRTVERLNDIVHASTLTSRFVSMFYGELEHNGTFIYVNAGHPPPFHLAADGEVTYLEEGGPVLGPLPEVTYDRGLVLMEAGDLLVLYTDGIVEATRGGLPAGEEYGVERLVETARAHQDKSAAEVVDAIFEGANDWSHGTEPQDDRTVVVVAYPGA